MHGIKRSGGSAFGAGQKRPRQDDDDDMPGSFEEHLANLVEEDDLELEDSPRFDGEGPDQESTYHR